MHNATYTATSHPFGINDSINNATQALDFLVPLAGWRENAFDQLNKQKFFAQENDYISPTPTPISIISSGKLTSNEPIILGITLGIIALVTLTAITATAICIYKRCQKRGELGGSANRITEDEMHQSSALYRQDNRDFRRFSRFTMAASTSTSPRSPYSPTQAWQP